MTIGMRRAASSMVFFCAPENPVVPITIARVLKMRERAFRAREVDEYVAGRGDGRVGADFYAAGWRARHVEGGAELESAIRLHRLDERAAHPPAGAGDRNLHRPAAGDTISPSMRASLLSSKKSATLRCSRLPSVVSRQ